MRYRSLLLGAAIVAATGASVVGVVSAAQYQHESPAPALENPISFSPSTGSDQSVTVHVPRTAILTIDASGKVVSATTNTGTAPQRGDDVYLRRPDGSVVRSTTFDVAQVQWVGDFSEPGVAQPQN